MRIEITRIEEILEPTRRRLIYASLLIALLVNVLPWHGWALNLRPDLVAVVLLHWCIREPLKIGFLVAWVFGLFMDVAEGSLLGQHAMAYVVLVYLALLLSRRLQMFDMRFQVLHILPILLLSQLVILTIRLISGADFPGWTYFLPSVTGAAIWPIVYMCLEIPRRPRRDFDRE
jgi:rod shape-determining protein MreD